MIRGSTIKYSSQRKKQWQEEEAKIVQDIKLIEEEVNANFLNISEDVLDELENKKIFVKWNSKRENWRSIVKIAKQI